MSANFVFAYAHPVAQRSPIYFEHVCNIHKNAFPSNVVSKSYTEAMMCML